MVHINQLKGLEIGWTNKSGDKNPIWVGDKIGYEGLHGWIKRNKPKMELCECCNKNKSYDLANVSGEYKRDINDFEWLCRKCHMKKDGRIEQLSIISKNQIHSKRTIEVIKECSVCKKEYIIIKNKIKTNKFCSNKCRGHYISSNKLFYGNQFIKCQD